MYNQFRALPPLKRFRLMQQQEELDPNGSDVISSRLPAKKRKEARSDDSVSPTNGNPTAYCLPAKKRVWALERDSLSGKPFSSFDLNVEYKLSPKKEKETKDSENDIPVVLGLSSCGVVKHGSNARVENKENIDPLVKGNNKVDLNETIVDEEVENDDGILCAVCQSTDGDPLDPIVFCDGCDLMVHATCYGNPLIKGIPEGDWFCSQCLVSQSQENQINGESETISCCLCPVKGGAIKPTKDGRWAHVVCALYVPEVFFQDPEGREGIDCSEIPKRRWRERCYICMKRNGCAIECSEQNCPLGFHVTCGLKENLCIEYKEGKNGGGAIVAGFCKDHTVLWEKQQLSGKYKIVARCMDKK